MEHMVQAHSLQEQVSQKCLFDIFLNTVEGRLDIWSKVNYIGVSSYS